MHQEENYQHRRPGIEGEWGISSCQAIHHEANSLRIDQRGSRGDQESNGGDTEPRQLGPRQGQQTFQLELRFYLLGLFFLLRHLVSFQKLEVLWRLWRILSEPWFARIRQLVRVLNPRHAGYLLMTNTTGMRFNMSLASWSEFYRESRAKRASRLRNPAIRSILLLLTLFTVSPVLVIAQEVSRDEQLEQPRGISFRKSTRRILDDNKLKDRAKKDPTSAIVALDGLRSSGAEPAEEVALAIAEVAIQGAYGEASETSAGLFLRAASETYSASLEQAAARGPLGSSDSKALSELALQVKAVEGLLGSFEQIVSESSDVFSMALPGPLGEYELDWVNETGGWGPATHRYLGASTLKRNKKDIEETRSGLGAPIVAVRRGDLPEKPHFEGSIFPVYEYYYPLTAVLSFGSQAADAPRQASIHLIDPRQVDTTTLGDTEYPLASDLGSQYLTLHQETDMVSGLAATRNPGRFMALVGLYAMEPLRRDKIPLVLVHGLNSSQKTWDGVYDNLMLDTELRERYQIWAFSYPSGLPFPVSATFLRQALTETIQGLDPEGKNPLLNQTVLVGHSMGGLLVRLQICDSGVVLWNAVFAESPQDTDLEPQDLEAMESILVFDSLPFVTRTIFFSVPHRGTKQAGNMLGKFGATLVKLPDGLKELGDRVATSEQDLLVGKAAERGKFPDSVQTLQPGYPLIMALDQIPIDPDVTYHSVIGDKGQGDTPDSSDGFVPYWSSHLDGAASERIVPSAHRSHKDPEGMEELARILHVHLDSVGVSD